MINVIRLQIERHDLGDLVADIKKVVYAREGISVTEAIGAIEIAKLEILKEQEANHD